MPSKVLIIQYSDTTMILLGAHETSTRCSLRVYFGSLFEGFREGLRKKCLTYRSCMCGYLFGAPVGVGHEEAYGHNNRDAGVVDKALRREGKLEGV